jgi:hypothetical protein
MLASQAHSIEIYRIRNKTTPSFFYLRLRSGSPNAEPHHCIALHSVFFPGFLEVASMAKLVRLHQHDANIKCEVPGRLCVFFVVIFQPDYVFFVLVICRQISTFKEPWLPIPGGFFLFKSSKSDSNFCWSRHIYV